MQQICFDVFRSVSIGSECSIVVRWDRFVNITSYENLFVIDNAIVIVSFVEL